MDWTREEVLLIIADYFNMLQLEIAQVPYNKTQHRKALLPLLNNRKNGSVEFKHQNISAVLLEMGLPFIRGYKPMHNYQQMLADEVAEFLSANQIQLEARFETFSEKSDVNAQLQRQVDFNSLLIDEPIISAAAEDRELYRPIKTNYLEKEQNNRILGAKGENLVLEYEKWRLINNGKKSLANKIKWVSKDLGDGLGYDILSKNIDGSDRFIEVKTTKLTRETPIFLTKTELRFAESNSKNFSLYRVFNFDTKPGLFIRNGVYNSFCLLKPETFKGYFN